MHLIFSVHYVWIEIEMEKWCIYSFDPVIHYKMCSKPSDDFYIHGAELNVLTF